GLHGHLPVPVRAGDARDRLADPAVPPAASVAVTTKLNAVACPSARRHFFLERLEAVSVVSGGVAAVRRGLLSLRGAAATLLPGLRAGAAGEDRQLHPRPADHARVAAGPAARALRLFP